MKITTNQLREGGKRAALPVIACSALLLGIGSYAFRPAKAAMSSGAPMSNSSVAPLVDVDQAVEAVAARVTPAVVNIAVTAKAPQQTEMGSPADDQQDGNNDDPMEQFRRFFQQMGPGMNMGPSAPQIEHGIGSGIIISPDGYIVTNDHVVDGATQVRVTLYDRRTFPARVIGKDKLTDLAVVKIDAQDLPSLPWGDSATLRPGQTVLAFGNPFGQLQFSVTRGIVSALNRQSPSPDNARKPGGYIQTDAAINPGNSGGPLVDAHGEVVGINTYLISDSGSFAGAGFAIPSAIARPITAELIKNGKVNHGYLGIGINDVTPDNAKFFDVANDEGAVVSQVTPGSPAERAGIRQGDVITAINGKPVDTASDLQMAVIEDASGTPVSLDILRNGQPEHISVTLGQFNGNRQVASSDEGDSNNSHARLGVAVSDLTPDVRQQLNLPDQITGGVAVEQVRPGSPAEDAGLSSGDVILQVDRKPVKSAEQFRNEVEQVPAGKDILLLVWGDGGESYRVVHPASTDSGM
jgi:serine protease Do